MAKLSSSHIVGPLKTVLPGIIVSLIGGTAGILIFNNPTKIKGRSTLSAWHSVIQYEKIYDDNLISTVKYADLASIDGLKKYKGDVIHQIQMLSENFKNVKEESNIDNRLFAIINCKVDTYDQIYRLTDIYLDSLVKLAEHPEKYFPTANETDSSYNAKILSASVNIMTEYNRQKQHLIDRDSSTINNTLEQLTQSYTRTLYKFNFTPRLPDEYKSTLNNIYGSWDFLVNPGGFTIQKDNSGTIMLNNLNWKGKWQLQNDFTLILTKDAKDSTFTVHVVNVSERTIRLAINDTMQLIGFKRTD